MARVLKEVADQIFDTDVLIIGSEGAGARAAVEAAEHGLRVAVVTKGPVAKSGATLTAGTDIDAAGKDLCDLCGLPADERDTKETFFKDMLVEGRFINHQIIVERHVQDAGARIKELMDWGMRVCPSEPVAWQQGHSFRRGVMSTGREVLKALIRGLDMFRGQIEYFENTMAIDLLTSEGRVVGAVAVDLNTGEFLVFPAKATIMATGGGLKIFPFTSGNQELTGDGHAMARRVGAEFMDAQQVQFITCMFFHPPVSIRSVNPILNMGTWLLNRFGERFMVKYDPERLERSTRDNIGIAIMKEIWDKKGVEDETGLYSYVWMSQKHLPKNLIDFWSRQASLHCLSPPVRDRLGDNAIPVFSGSHFFCGGIKINEKCETNVPGLYAAGEATGGAEGSNRLSGNAVTQILVQGKWAGEAASEYTLKAREPEIDVAQVEEIQKMTYAPLERKDGIDSTKLKKRIQTMAYEDVGVIRIGSKLESAIREIERMKSDIPNIYSAHKGRVFNRSWIDALEIRNMLETLEIIARCALFRTESRGNHYRVDYPETDNKNWLKNVVAKDVNGEVKIWTEPIVTTPLGEKFLPI
jgi:succinate dehydrogenase/fumarate reductase flavoprotein subunit